MESTVANVDFSRYRRLIRTFWDPEPVNDIALDQTVWCLGAAYRLSDDDGCHESVTASGSGASQGPSRQPIREPLSLSPLERPGDETGPQRGIPRTNTEVLSGSSAVDDTIVISTPFISSSSNGELQPPAHACGGWPRGFLDDFESRFWMTYRSDFEPIPSSSDPGASTTLTLPMRIRTRLGGQSSFSSDIGWGCMIRSGQSLLANALSMLRLGRDWRRGTLRREERSLVSLFADDPRAPYSIHNFVRHGATACGKYPGEWFGPSATASCIRALVNAQDPHLRVYSTGNGPDVYEDSIMRVAKPGGGNFHPTLILVGTRLGIDTITPVYWDALISALQMPQSVGIAGGRPSSSYYFVGAQESCLFYLDPHHTRPALAFYPETDKYADHEIASCHTSRLRKMHVREMDPSMLIGFLVRNEEDWLDWRQRVEHFQGKSVIQVAKQEPRNQESANERAGAIDQVELLSDDDETSFAA